MKLTRSQVKNLMRRGPRFLVDPEPESEEKQRCIAFFDHHCAYFRAAPPNNRLQRTALRVADIEH